jgi:hypothetical protein
MSPESVTTKELVYFMISEGKIKARKLYLLAHEEFEQAKKQNSIRETKKKRIEAEMEIEAKVLNIATAIQYVQSAIISKIQNATKDYQTIRGKLQGRVSLPNGGVVIDPLSSNNLYGFRYLLFKNYGKVDMVICCKMLLNLLSLEFPNRLAVTTLR